MSETLTRVWRDYRDVDQLPEAPLAPSGGTAVRASWTFVEITSYPAATTDLFGFGRPLPHHESHPKGRPLLWLVDLGPPRKSKRVTM